MEKTIAKNIKVEIKVEGTKYCSEKCPFSSNEQCLLGKCLNVSDTIEIRKKIKNKLCRTEICKKTTKKDFKKNDKSFLYRIKPATFYAVGYNAKNLKEAAKMLGTSEGNLKWFIYDIHNSIYKNEDRKSDRIERACAYFDGHNEARKDKIKE